METRSKRTKRSTKASSKPPAASTAKPQSGPSTKKRKIASKVERKNTTAWKELGGGPVYRKDVKAAPEAHVLQTDEKKDIKRALPKRNSHLIHMYIYIYYIFNTSLVDLIVHRKQT